MNKHDYFEIILKSITECRNGVSNGDSWSNIYIEKNDIYLYYKHLPWIFLRVQMSLWCSESHLMLFHVVKKITYAICDK